MLGNIQFTQNIHWPQNLRHLHKVDKKTTNCIEYIQWQSGHDRETHSPFALIPVVASMIIIILIELEVLKLQTGRNTENKISTTKQLLVICD